MLFDFLKRISVEPAVFLSTFAWNIFAMTNDLGIYRVICDKFFNSNGGDGLNNHSKFECWNTGESLGANLSANDSIWWRKAETILQQEVATFTIISTIIILVPSTIAIVILGAFGDRQGRKGVLLLAISGVLIVMTPLPILFSAPVTTPIYIIYIANLLAGLTGLIGSIMTSGAAYLSDITKDKDTLTVRMTGLQLSLTLSSILGPLAAVGLMTVSSYTWTVLTAMTIACTGFLSAVVLIKRTKPPELTEKETEMLKMNDDTFGAKESAAKRPEKETFTNTPEIGSQSDTQNEKGCVETIKGVIKDTPSLLAESWRTVSKPREGRKRAYIFVLTVINFITASAEALFIGPVFTIYVQKTPISWAQGDISTYRAITNTIRLLGGAAGVFIFKKIFRMTDTSIMVLSIISQFGEMVIFAVSSTPWMLYLAACIGLLTSLMYPCTQSFLAYNVEPNEVGKAYGAVGLVISLAFFFGIVGTGAIYKATVTIFPPLIFALSAAMLGVALVLAGWLHCSFRQLFKTGPSLQTPDQPRS